MSNSRSLHQEHLGSWLAVAERALMSEEKTMPNDKSATLYRMVLPDHTCPFGTRAKQMLEEAGFQIDDRILRSREEVDAFEDEHGVETTPQIFINDDRVGGSDDLERYLKAG